jgi:hypothetical protein
MSDFIEAALSFPTVVFSVLLGVTIVYWVFTLLTGGLQLGTGGGGGGGGLLDTLDGLDGAADGTLGGGGGGNGNVFDGLEGGKGGIFSDLTDALGLGTVPSAVILSLLVLFAWFFSLVGTSFVDSLALGGLATALLTVGVVVLAITVSIGTTMLVTKPIGRLFVHTEGQARAALVGRTCVVQTGRVDHTFGQAEVTDAEGASLLVPVRTTGDTRFVRGDTALLIDYDDDLDAYIVATVD